jgi:hypothetical protein
MEAWLSYEDATRFLIDKCRLEFGLKAVEGKQEIEGHRSGTKWEIEGKGIREGDTRFFIIECRRYTTSRLEQEALGHSRYSANTLIPFTSMRALLDVANPSSSSVQRGGRSRICSPMLLSVSASYPTSEWWRRLRETQ